MNKKIASVIFLITVICITAAVILSPKEEMKENGDKMQENIYNDDTYQEFKKYITSTEELKHDTVYYVDNVRSGIRKTFDVLNDETDKILNDLFDNKSINIDEKLNIIKRNEAEISAEIDNALEHFKSDDYVFAFKTLKKYIILQNKMIYKLADIYKDKKSLDYNEYGSMLHNTHQDMTEQEINYINFLSGVDLYADEKK